jgi:tRNA uridine 5-carboxymethylaminomethyl modification enzyme
MEAAQKVRIAGHPLSRLLRRTEFTAADVPTDLLRTAPLAAWEAVEADLKYEGYIRHEDAEFGRAASQSECRLPDGIDYRSIAGLRAEAQQKLEAAKPQTYGDAQRLPGITPVDISTVRIHIKSRSLQVRKDFT